MKTILESSAWTLNKIEEEIKTYWKIKGKLNHKKKKRKTQQNSVKKEKRTNKNLFYCISVSYTKVKERQRKKNDFLLP